MDHPAKNLDFTDFTELEYFSFLEHQTSINLQLLRDFGSFILDIKPKLGIPSSFFFSISLQEFEEIFTLSEIETTLDLFKELYSYLDKDLTIIFHLDMPQLNIVEKSPGKKYFEGLDRINFYVLKNAINRLLEPKILTTVSRIPETELITKNQKPKLKLSKPISNFIKGEKIKTIEFLEDKSKLKRIYVFINEDYLNERNYGRGKYWGNLYDVADKSYLPPDYTVNKDMTDYFNTNLNNPLYSKKDFALTKILTIRDNDLIPEKGINITIITKQKLGRRLKIQKALLKIA